VVDGFRVFGGKLSQMPDHGLALQDDVQASWRGSGTVGSSVTMSRMDGWSMRSGGGAFCEGLCARWGELLWRGRTDVGGLAG
jgi:hypothetical protein